ncbi:hypothetical protein ASD44_05355 [Mesorhizobium sp. Root554]|uniref:hypothetical protein n=1 Tax=unclassified Mesorhizobium TaxID=325217 RepID=UPI0006F860FA|nr:MULTISPECIES: hypothetical protein [unclassified Mesorhizobium]KQZ13563.1 hypothetical protein ASD27_05360 [Mesorhizobium sp. Root1471]KQZ36074.1 hypothetical protein ASD44_05355 [Mesorhizobium sp. Root554]
MADAAIIARHHATLRRLLSLMLVYIGLADDTGQAMRFITGTAEADDADSSGDSAPVRAFRRLCDPATVSRRIHTMVRRILLPAEAAARRLVIVLAADLPTPALRPWELKRGRRVAGAVRPVALPRTYVAGIMAPLFAAPPPPVSTAPKPPVRMPRFSLVDPMKRFHRRRYAQIDCPPRASDPGRGRRPLPVRLEPTPYDRLPDQRLMRRVCALAAALDDLPKQARRFARWRVLRDYRLTLAGRIAPEARGGPRERFSGLYPLRVGRPPGAPPLSLPRHRWSAAQGVVLETHGLAWRALPDTS